MKINLKIKKIPLSCVIITAVNIMLIIYMILPASSIDTIVRPVRHSIIFMVTILLILALLIFVFKEKQLIYLSKNCKNYFYALIFVSVIMLIPTIIGIMLVDSQKYGMNYFILDFLSILLYTSGIVYAPPDRHDFLKKSYLIFGFFGIVFGTIGLLSIDFNINLISDRNLNTWTTSYFLWFSLYAWSALLIMNLLGKKQSGKVKEKIIVYLSTFLYLLLGILFLKRVILIEIVVIVIVIIMKSDKLNVAIKISMYILLMVLFIIILSNVFSFNVNNLINLIVARFRKLDILSFNRFVEFINGIKNFNLLNYFIGRGYGSLHFGLGWEHGNMHIGWLNYIFKGGLVFFIVQLTFFIKILKIFLFSRKNSLYAIFSSIAIFNFVIAGVSTYWTPTPAILMFSTFVFASLDR